MRQQMKTNHRRKRLSRKVLIVGDSPLIETGFGRVNLQAAKAFQTQGWKVASVAGLTTEPKTQMEQGIRMYYPNQDVLGVTRFQQALVEFQPDVVYMTADAGTATALAANLPAIPSLLYIPIEGEPLGNYDWRRLVSSLPTVTCSQYGVKRRGERLVGATSSS
jgi:hypothetical protein